MTGLGGGSRRQSSVPRPGNTDDSSSQCGGSSPLLRPVHERKLERAPLFLLDSVSRTTLNDDEEFHEEMETRAANVKLALDDMFVDANPKLRNNARVHSTIASSSSTSDYPVIRESRSLDPLPISSELQSSRRLDSSPRICVRERKKSFRSLENCDKCTRNRRNSKTEDDIDDKVLNNNYPNGNVIIVPRSDNLTSDVDTPLLSGDGSCVGELVAVKRWRSLDQVVPNQNQSGGGEVPDKKSSARNSIRSWLVNLFNGNGLRSSDVSLRRGVITGYDMQSERESIV